MTPDQFKSLAVQEYLKAQLPDSMDSLPNGIAQHFTLDLRSNPNISNSVTIGLGSTGEVSAESVKLYNVLRISQNDLKTSLFPGLMSAVFGFNIGTSVAMLLSTLSLIASFLPYAKKKFSKQDAQVLYAIYSLDSERSATGKYGLAPILAYFQTGQLSGNAFEVYQIQQKYNELFDLYLEEESLVSSLQILADYRTLGVTDNNLIYLNETIEITRE